MPATDEFGASCLEFGLGYFLKCCGDLPPFLCGNRIIIVDRDMMSTRRFNFSAEHLNLSFSPENVHQNPDSLPCRLLENSLAVFE